MEAGPLQPQRSQRRPTVAARGRQVGGGGCVDGETRGVKNGGLEGTVSRGLRHFLPARVNQKAAHGCNEVENKKNIKVSGVK